MKKFVLITGLITILLIAGFAYFTSINKQKETSLPANHEYFWLTTCSHCKNVADFMESWSGKDKLKIDKYEVASDRAKAQVLVERGNYCSLPKESLGSVPLLFTPEGKCFLGDVDIIEYLKGLNL